MILSTLLWSQPKVSVLRHPSPGSRSGISLMDASDDELHSHGLFHRDHSQLLCSQGNSPSYPPPGIPPLEPKDTLLAPTSENLLASAGVGRGSRGQSQPRAPTAPGVHQMRPTAPHRWAPTPGRQETNQATPYRQQVYPPQHATPKLSTTPSTSQGHEEMAREGEDARGRSSS